MTPSVNVDLTMSQPSQSLDAQIKRIIRCEDCSKIFTAPGKHKYTSFLLENRPVG
jgi:hypothetical protein